MAAPFLLNSIVALSTIACRPPSSHDAMAMRMDMGCSGAPHGAGPTGPCTLFCAVFHWLHRGSGRHREFLFLTEDGTVAFKRVTKNKHTAVSPAHGVWKLSRAGNGLRLDIQRFHCTGWREYLRDHTFVQVGPPHPFHMKDVEDRRDITFVGLFWIRLAQDPPCSTAAGTSASAASRVVCSASGGAAASGDASSGCAPGSGSPP
jgi:hypothetical protein